MNSTGSLTTAHRESSPTTRSDSCKPSRRGEAQSRGPVSVLRRGVRLDWEGVFPNGSDLPNLGYPGNHLGPPCVGRGCTRIMAGVRIKENEPIESAIRR